MSGIVKGAKKLAKGIIKPIGKSVEESLDIGRGLMKKVGLKPADIPDAPKNPLMPDLESIEKSRRRRRNQKMGRTETIMTDTLG